MRYRPDGVSSREWEEYPHDNDYYNNNYKTKSFQKQSIMKPYSFYRAAGRQDLQGHWAEAAMLTFVYFIVAGGFSLISSAAFPVITGTAFPIVTEAWSPIITEVWSPVFKESGSLLSYLLLPMAWGYRVSFLNNHRKAGGYDPFDISWLVEGYRDFWRIFSTCFLQCLYIFLWALLLFIPGIVKACSYSMTIYILKDRPDMARNEAIEYSMAMMQGHKLDYFVLWLTFLGWLLLSILTLGIGLFWLIPYVYSTLANFYEDVKREFDNGGCCVDEDRVANDSFSHS